MKVLIFYGIRVALGMLCASSETYFFIGVKRKFGKRVAFYCLIFLLCSPGMFIASTSKVTSASGIIIVFFRFST